MTPAGLVRSPRMNALITSAFSGSVRSSFGVPGNQL
jgi:hypothetical protein